MRSRADVVAMVGSDAHQGLISRGLLSLPRPSVVTVDGDSAVAVCESDRWCVNRDDGFTVRGPGRTTSD